MINHCQGDDLGFSIPAVTGTEQFVILKRLKHYICNLLLQKKTFRDLLPFTEFIACMPIFT